jgi:hypothetical protein
MTLHFLDIRACFLRWQRKWICENWDLLCRSQEYGAIHYGDPFMDQPEFMPGLGD